MSKKIDSKKAKSGNTFNFSTKEGNDLLTSLKESIEKTNDPKIINEINDNLKALLAFVKQKSDEKDEKIQQTEVANGVLSKQIATIEQQNSNLTKLRKMVFGSISEADFIRKAKEIFEKIKDNEHLPDNAIQEDLFNPTMLYNEIEGILEGNEAIDAVTGADKDKKEEAKTKNRHGKKKGVKNCLSPEVLKNLGIEVRNEILPFETICPVCNEELVEVGSVVESSTLEYIPSKVILVEKIRKTMKCKSCEKDGIENNDAREYMFRSEEGKVPQLIPHSVVGASLLTQIIYSKFCNAMPFYRLEKDMKNTYNLPITRGLMCSWASNVYDSYLIPLIDVYKEELLQQPAIHADETGILVLKKKTSSSNNKDKDEDNLEVKKGRGYMWVYSSTKWENKQVCLFQYESGRAGKYPENYLNDFNGYIHTDAYDGYNKVDVKGRCLCWVHLRRKFIDAFEAGPILNKQETVLQAIAHIDGIFKNERTYNLLPPEERYELRLKETKPKLDAFFEWCAKIQGSLLPQSLMGAAINYTLDHKDGFYTFLKDGRLDVSNNTAESRIRSFTVVRKNCLFCITDSGADVSATYTSIIATAKANNLAPNKYLQLLLEKLPSIPGITKYSAQLKTWLKNNQNTPKPIMPSDIKEALQKLMPWNEEIQDTCLSYEAREKKTEPELPILHKPKTKNLGEM